MGEVCAENVLLSWPDSSPKGYGPCQGSMALFWQEEQGVTGVTWHRAWRGRSDVLWMLTAQDMGRDCLSQ